MKKRILILVLCLSLMIPAVSAMADESLLSYGGTTVKAGESIGFKVNLGAVPEEYGTYSLAIKINPSPEKVSVSPSVNITESAGKYTMSSADLEGVTSLSFEVFPESNISSDVSYSVSAMVAGENGGKGSDQFSFIVKAPEQQMEPTDPTDPTKPTEQITPTKPTDQIAPTKPTNQNIPNNSKPSGNISGDFSGEAVDRSLVYAGSADNYLEKLSVSGYEFTRDFNKTRNTYFVTVKNGASALNVSATPSDTSADVSITGNDNVTADMSKIQINVTADNGDVRIYRIYVTHETDNPQE